MNANAHSPAQFLLYIEIKFDISNYLKFQQNSVFGPSENKMVLNSYKWKRSEVYLTCLYINWEYILGVKLK